MTNAPELEFFLNDDLDHKQKDLEGTNNHLVIIEIKSHKSENPLRTNTY
jgi:hypothetical protein